nr:glyoxysomal fatty acid beta-oxidation multifunctional protein MFP-a-like [Tanacetum cinerariifolium]
MVHFYVKVKASEALEREKRNAEKAQIRADLRAQKEAEKKRRGGLLFWADSIGSKYVCQMLEEWSKTYEELFKPCAYLAE